MESFLGRYRNLIILMGVLFLQLLGLAVQVKRSESENTRVIRIWAVEAIAPFERALVSVQNSCGSLWHNYFYGACGRRTGSSRNRSSKCGWGRCV